MGVKSFFKKAFDDMKESAKAQHEVDKAEFAAAKAEAKANFEENRGHNTFAKAKADAKKSWDDAHMTPAERNAKMQEEIKTIRQKYAAPEQIEDKMTQLRRLDGAVTKKATTVALVFGVVGTLILGIGMSLAMTDIGQLIGLSGSLSMLCGIIIGVIGIVLVSVAYPLYNHTIKKEREKIAPEIIRLTDELMK